MRRIPRFILGLSCVSFLASPSAVVLARPAADWQATVKNAKGAEVRFAMWGGSENINAWVDKWVAPEMRKRHGIVVKRVPVRDVAESINKLVSQKQSGRSAGTLDVLWINGENFKMAKQAGVLAGPFVDRLPSYRAHYEWKSTANTMDFGTPTEGFEAPYGRAQFVFVHDSAKVPVPPRSWPELKEWIKKNPGKFTYPAPPDFTGSAFVRQLVYATSGGADQFLPKVDLALLQRKLPAAWAWLDDVKPYLWRKGVTYPENKARLDQLFADGEVAMSMGYSPTTAEADVRKGVLPRTTRTFVLEEGTLANTHFLAIPFNAPAKDAAMVLVDFLGSPEAQLSKFDPKWWGDFPALELTRVPADLRRAFEGMDLGVTTLPVATLEKRRVSEVAPEYVVLIEKEWAREIASKPGSP